MEGGVQDQRMRPWRQRQAGHGQRAQGQSCPQRRAARLELGRLATWPAGGRHGGSPAAAAAAAEQRSAAIPPPCRLGAGAAGAGGPSTCPPARYSPRSLQAAGSGGTASCIRVAGFSCGWQGWRVQDGRGGRRRQGSRPCPSVERLRSSARRSRAEGKRRRTLERCRRRPGGPGSHHSVH